MVKKLGVNESCTGCGLCAEMCPKGVLSIIDGRARHERPKDCTLCMRCMDFCPQEAVTYGGKVKKPLYKGPDKETFKAIVTDKKA